MKPVYERGSLMITEFDTEDVITTSGMLPEDPTNPTDATYATDEKENIIGGYDDFNPTPGAWF